MLNVDYNSHFDRAKNERREVSNIGLLNCSCNMLRTALIIYDNKQQFFHLPD